MQKKYDITLCILACAKNQKYINRLKEFINSYGYKLYNINIKIKVVFLVEDEPRPDFLDPSIVWYNCDSIPLSMRLLHYIKSEDCDSDWLMQVDDDSSTDIDKTLEMLDSLYDKNDCLLLMGGRNTDLESGLQNILKIMKYKNIFFGSSNISKFDTTPYFIHAWEPSILSSGAINRIKEYPRLQEFYDLCSKYKPTFGDQVPYVIAKIAKIPIVECLFLSPFCKTAEYSAINPDGRFTHIHYITEKMGNYHEFITKMKTIKMNPVDAAIQTDDNIWEFWAYENGHNRPICILELLPNGLIGNYDHPNEKFWEKNEQGNSITLLNLNKEPTCVLYYDQNTNEYSGQFLYDKQILHKLRKIKND